MGDAVPSDLDTAAGLRRLYPVSVPLSGSSSRFVSVFPSPLGRTRLVNRGALVVHP
jgi:hypothetical protein